jgi:Polyribonucleotide nucleotidyltransferase (polynucleotide phosphorylase)
MKFGMKFEGEDFEVQINEVAIHADGATLLRYGDTVVLSTVVSSKKMLQESIFYL